MNASKKLIIKEEVFEKEFNNQQQSTPKKDCSSFLSSISAALATKCISIFRKTPKTNESKQEFFPNTDNQETTMSLETRNISKTLVMDLDETLIFASKNQLDDSDFEIQLENEEKFFVKKRPYLEEFLEIANEHFELIIFTASLEDYADKIIDKIDPENRVKKRFYRQNCDFCEKNYYIKDLSILNSDLENIIFLDNSVHALDKNPENAILVKTFFGENDDKELPKILDFLLFLKDIKEDLRPIEKWALIYNETIFSEHMEDKREHSKRYKISSLTNIEESISIEGFNEKISTSDI